MTNGTLKELRDQIRELFNSEELQSLCLDLSIPYEDISGTTLSAKAVALISYCERHGLMDQLLVRCKELRPAAIWPTYRTRLVRDLEEIRSLAKAVYNAKDFLALNRHLAEAEILFELSGEDASTNELLAEIRYLRSDLRNELGRPSTLLVTGNSREIYRLTKELLDNHISVIIDNNGSFGVAGEPVDVFVVLLWARDTYLNQIRDLCRERIERADLMKQKTPSLALKTLKEAKDILNDELFTSDDLALLEATSRLVDYKIAEIQRST